MYGDLEITVGGKKYSLNEGDTLRVLPGVWHDFSSKNGAIIEEISTTHYKNDSVYQDPKISNLPVEERKLKVKNWGRYELFDLADFEG